jgi:hypothetical protein
VSPREYSGARSVARKLALQALYRWQLNAAPWQDLVLEFKDAEDMPRADAEYFRARWSEGVWHARGPRRAPGRLGRPGTRSSSIRSSMPACSPGLRAQRVPRGAVPGRHQRGGGARQRFGATDGHSSSTPCSIGRHRELRPDEH